MMIGGMGENWENGKVWEPQRDIEHRQDQENGLLRLRSFVCWPLPAESVRGESVEKIVQEDC